MSTYFSMNDLADSSDRIGFLTNQEDRTFFNFILNGLDLSYQDDFNTNYKIAGFSVFRNLHKTTYSRALYTLLDLVGDCGGFLDGWLVIGTLLCAWFSKYKASVYFMQKAFYTTTAQTFAKAKSSHVRQHYSMLRKRQGAHELTRRGMLEGMPFNSPQIQTLT
jgi:hypothetical protein